jgi:acetolactate synthase-1/2/3 large subunit
VEEALDALAKAERPAIMAGGGVMFSGAQPELREFSELARIPVLATAKARGAVSEATPLGYGAYQLLGNPAVQEAAGGPADVIMLLGARIGMFTGAGVLGGGTIIPPDATVIQVDIEPEEIGRARDIQIGLVGDVRETLRLLLDRARQRTFQDHERWIEALSAGAAAQRGAHDEAASSSEPPIHQARLAREIADFLGGDSILVADGGETSVWMGGQAVVASAGRYLSHGYLGCLGVGLPFGLAAKLAHPEKRVLTLIGDGSTGLNFAEFDTAVRHDLPLVVVVNNDQGWGMSRQGQIATWGADRRVAVELGAVRYDLAAAGFGAYAEFVERPEEIRPALERAFASGRPACLNVMTDPNNPVMDYGAGRRREEAKDEVDLPYYGRRRSAARA